VIRLPKVCFEVTRNEFARTTPCDFQESKFASQSTRLLGFYRREIGAVIPKTRSVVSANTS
jgi:hypothetical protein